MSAAPVVLERVARVAPLGIRFWDEVTASPISVPLSVTGYFPSQPDRTFLPVRNHSNVYVFYGLPGLRAFEYGGAAGDPRPFVITVQDNSSQFLPAAFTAFVPFRGLFELPFSSPPLGVPGVPLFTGTGRPVASGMAAIRLELHDAVSGAAAAWVRVEASFASSLPPVRGMSDAQGQATLLFPYPEPTGGVGGSPPDADSVPLQQQTWPIDIAAWYSPVQPTPAAPDLETFFAQRPANLWADAARTQAFHRTSLLYGRETGQILFVSPEP